MKFDLIDYHKYLNLRYCIICFAAASVSLPMAWISLAKILLFVIGLVYLIINLIGKQNDRIINSMWTTRIILLALGTFALSISWTSVDLETSLMSLVKHGKILEIILIVFLIRSQSEAKVAITIFMIFQIFIILTAWLLVSGIRSPWLINSSSSTNVFCESYIDQSIMFSMTAAIVWLLRSHWPWPRIISFIIAIAALLYIFFVLPSFTGYIVSFIIINIISYSCLPKFKLLFIVPPLIILMSAYQFINQYHIKVSSIIDQSINYIENNSNMTSAGWRLNAWKDSLEAITLKPALGYGVGGWMHIVKIKEIKNDTKTNLDINSNPHQEFLLWGVELGYMGILILLGMIASIAVDARKFQKNTLLTSLSALSVLTVASLMNSAIYDDLIGDFLCITIGLILSFGIMESLQKTSQPLNPDKRWS